MPLRSPTGAPGPSPPLNWAQTAHVRPESYTHTATLNSHPRPDSRAEPRGRTHVKNVALLSSRSFCAASNQKAWRDTCRRRWGCRRWSPTRPSTSQASLPACQHFSAHPARKSTRSATAQATSGSQRARYVQAVCHVGCPDACSRDKPACRLWTPLRRPPALA